MIQWRVNVGWCGGEFAIELYMHADLETLRSTILPTELQCHEADQDGTITISNPEYGSIEALDLKLQLRGGKGTAMFQPIGFSHPIHGERVHPLTLPKMRMKQSSIWTSPVTTRGRSCGPHPKYAAQWLLIDLMPQYREAQAT